jgi:hypothetical protein
MHNLLLFFFASLMAFSLGEIGLDKQEFACWFVERFVITAGTRKLQ